MSKKSQGFFGIPLGGGVLGWILLAAVTIYSGWLFLEEPANYVYFGIFLCAIIFPLAWSLKLAFRYVANEKVAYPSAIGTSCCSLILVVGAFFALSFLVMGITNTGFGQGSIGKLGAPVLIPIVFIASAFSFWVQIGSRLSPTTRNRPLGLFSKDALFISLIMAVMQPLSVAFSVAVMWFIW